MTLTADQLADARADLEGCGELAVETHATLQAALGALDRIARMRRAVAAHVRDLCAREDVAGLPFVHELLDIIDEADLGQGGAA
jgi:hypothetical protein